MRVLYIETKDILGKTRIYQTKYFFLHFNQARHNVSAKR